MGIEEVRGGVEKAFQKIKGGLGGMVMGFLSPSGTIVLLIFLLADIVVEDRGEEIPESGEEQWGGQ
jgi:hypothetical protein